MLHDILYVLIKQKREMDRDEREGKMREDRYKLFDSEKKVMEVLWEHGTMTAGDVVKVLRDSIGWNRNTTYTVIKKCIAKGAIERTEPKFQCTAVITKEQVQDYETNELVDKMFDGSKEKFFAAFLDGGKLSEDEVKNLKDMVNHLK
jgi:predicted transcriptional regulator